jgi:hypothetical protein
VATELGEAREALVVMAVMAVVAFATLVLVVLAATAAMAGLAVTAAVAAADRALVFGWLMARQDSPATVLLNLARSGLAVWAEGLRAAPSQPRTLGARALAVRCITAALDRRY